MFKKYNPEQVAQKWKELSSLTKFKEALNEGGLLLDIKKAPNGVTYGIVRESANYYIKYSKENKDVLSVSDFKYLGSMEKMLEKHKSYSSAIKRMNGMVHQLNEDVKMKNMISEMEDDEKLLSDFENIDGVQAPKDDTTETPIEPTEKIAQDEVPVEEIPQVEPTPESPVETAAPTEEPINTTTEPEEDTEKQDSNSSSDSESNTIDIQSILGKLQSEIQQLSDLTPTLTKNILNTTISATKDGIAELDPDDKEKIAKRIEKNGEKVNEEQDVAIQSWDKDSIASFLDEIGQEQQNFSSDNSGISIGDFGNVKFDSDGTSLYLHFANSEDASVAKNDFQNNSSGILNFDLKGNDLVISFNDGLDEDHCKDETPTEEIAAIEEPTNIDPEDKVAKLKAMIQAKVAEKQDGEVKVPTEEPESFINKIVNEEINSFKKGQIKNFLKENYIKKKSSFIKESIIKMFEDGLQIVHEDQYNDALNVVKQFMDDPKALEEGVLGDKFKSIAKPFIIAAFLSVLGGKVSAAVDQFKKATGTEPTQTEISQGIKTYEQKSGNKVDDKTDGPQPNETPQSVDNSLGGEDLGTYESPGKFAIDSNKVGLGSKLTDFKKINVDKAVAKYSDGGDNKPEFKELRGPRLDNKAVVEKPFEQLDDKKDSERLEKIWRLIAQDPTKALEDGVIKNQNDEILANNVELKDGQKIVFDFTFTNPDSKDFTDGKTPVKMLGGEIVKSGQSNPEKEVQMVWAKLKSPGAYDLGKIADPAKFKQMKDRLEQKGYKNQAGTNYWIQGEKSFWVDVDKAKGLYKQGKISFNNPSIEKDFRNNN